MNINRVSQLKSYAPQLRALGFSGENSLEQLLGAARSAAPELAAYLQVDLSTLANVLNNAQNSASSIPAAAMGAIQKATYALGVAIDHVPHLAAAPGVSAPTATPNVSHVADMPPIRDQGSRGTCVAHAVLAAYEHHLTKQNAYQDMSEQFLYWNCKRHDGIPNDEGTWIAVAMPQMRQNGCCLESTWPYHPTPIPGNEGQGPAPAGASLEALTFRAANTQTLAPTDVDAIKRALASDKCVAFSIPVFNSWYGSQWVAYSGDITMPLPNEIRVGGHAMCFVGYEDMSNEGLGGGRFILRNSWGANWGISSTHGAGYGTIPYAYIARMGVEAYSF